MKPPPFPIRPIAGAMAASIVALYARVSSQIQEEEGHSLETQVAMMKEVAARLGLTVGPVYRVQESAMPGSDRASLRRMFEDAAKGAFTSLMVVKMDRLARSIEVLRHIERNLQALGVELYEGMEKHNLHSVEGRLNRDVRAVIGEYSVNRLKWSAGAGRLELAKFGWPHSGTVPFGRKVLRALKKQAGNRAEWVLDEPKYELAQRMYRLYIEEDMTLLAAGRAVHMNPETVRRILMKQGGPEWRRTFVDPATGERVEILTQIPELFTEEQRKRLEEKARANQVERTGWTTRKRAYSLAGFVRCANAECGWSNFSGHQVYDASKTYPYYIHLPRKVCPGCTKSVPAEELEDEIFSRIGQLLRSETELEAAVTSALAVESEQRGRDEAEAAEIAKRLRKLDKEQEGLLRHMVEQAGLPLGEKIKNAIDQTNSEVTELRNKQQALLAKKQVYAVPADLPQRLRATVHKFRGLHGHAPVHWPLPAKRLLLQLFLGQGRVRFDRAEKGVRSSARGIFVRKVRGETGKSYWLYEVRGVIGEITGALSRVEAVYDKYMGEIRHCSLQKTELTQLARAVQGFGMSPPASKRSSASACRGTSLRCRLPGAARRGRCRQRLREAVRRASASAGRAPRRDCSGIRGFSVAP